MLNALKYTEILKEAGFSAEQAEKLVSLIVEAMEQNLASKLDVKDLRFESQTVRGELKKEIREVRGELKQEIQEVRGELKQEIQEVRGELKQEIQEVRGELKLEILKVQGQIEKMESKLTIRLGTMLAFSVAVMASMIKLL